MAASTLVRRRRPAAVTAAVVTALAGCVVAGAAARQPARATAARPAVPGGARPDARAGRPATDGDRAPSTTRTTGTTGTTAQRTAASWRDPIVTAAGGIDWGRYRRLAATYDSTAALEQRFGPGWAAFHPKDPQGRGLKNLYGAPDRGITDGWYRWNTDKTPAQIYATRDNWWWSEAGQLLYAPDARRDAGVALARSMASYFTRPTGTVLWHAHDTKVSWQGAGGDWYLRDRDYSVDRPPVVRANGGRPPARPVAAARSAVQRGMISIMAYRNGLLVAARNDAQVSQFNATARLAPGKVPTAVAVTPGNEFALVTVWDTRARKGQLAVVAVQGMLAGTHGGEHPSGQDDDPAHHAQDTSGLPSWFYVRSLKVVGYVDLPFAAPTSVATGLDRTATFDARAEAHTVASLGSQAERDLFARTADAHHVAARAGYAVVASRAENRVAFVDLQPLYQYYRRMYFTTQTAYEQTRHTGPGERQWPYTFAAAPEQRPRVAATLRVPSPTAVAAGIPRAARFRGTDDSLNEHAFVATMDGRLLTYRVGGLVTTAAAGTPRLLRTTSVGRNPTGISLGTSGDPADDLWVTSRGDRRITRIGSDGRVSVLQDARMKDPVSASASSGYGLHVLSVMDLDGKQALSYLTGDIEENVDAASTPDQRIRVGRGAPFEFAHATPVPGRPFAFSTAEVF